MNTKLVLDECIEMLRRGDTVEQCLARYPGLAAEIEPLLRTAVVLRQASLMKPRPEFRAQAKARVLAAVRESAARKQARQRSFFVRHAWVPAAASFAVLFALGSSTVLASSESLPGQPLYPVKVTVERAQLAVTPSQVGKAKLLASFADRRVKEIGSMVAAGQGDRVEAVSVSVVRDIERIPVAMGGKVAVRATEGARKAKAEGAERQAAAAAPAPPAASPSPGLRTAAPRPVAPAGPAQAKNSADAITTRATTALAPAVNVEKAVEESRDEVKKARNPAEVRAALTKEAARQKRYLEELLAKAPARDRPAIQKAMGAIVQAYEDAARGEKADDD